MNKLKAFWASLPHMLQAGLVTFATGAGVSLLDAASEGHFTRHNIITALAAGAAALRAFYMLPAQKPATPPAEGK